MHPGDVLQQRITASLVWESRRLLDCAEHEHTGRLLSQLVALAIVLTNKSKVAAIRASDAFSSSRAGTLGVRRVVTVGGTWVLQAWLRSMGGGSCDAGSLGAWAVGMCQGDVVSTPRFLALCYQVIKRDMIHSQLGDIFVCYFASMTSWRVPIAEWITALLAPELANTHDPRLLSAMHRSIWCSAAVMWHLTLVEERVRFHTLLHTRLPDGGYATWVSCGELLQSLGPTKCRPRKETLLVIPPGCSVYDVLKNAEDDLPKPGCVRQQNALWRIALDMTVVEKIVEGAVPGMREGDEDRILGALDSVCMGSLGDAVSARLQDIGLRISTPAGVATQAGLALWGIRDADGRCTPNQRLGAMLSLVGHGLGLSDAEQVLGCLGGRGVCTFLQGYMRGGLWALRKIADYCSHMDGLVDGIAPQFTIPNRQIAGNMEQEDDASALQDQVEANWDLAGVDVWDVSVGGWRDVSNALLAADGGGDTAVYKVTPGGFRLFLKSL
eukprot:Tamp_08844.p1 GENE.Tamp_08844~~Tamp_08844.p1  ORF type:complete len:496 (-),score=31.72 Tamp_08844:302-1789(-)